MGVDMYNRPATVDGSQAQWKVAVTHDGFVRFESKRNPGQVLTIYQNRRRRERRRSDSRRRSYFFLSTDKERPNNSSNSSEVELTDKVSTASTAADGDRAGARTRDDASISDDDDLWPKMQHIGQSTPLESNFLVHSVWGGLEIWDPQTGVALATVNPRRRFMSDSYDFGDREPESGLAECYPKAIFRTGCKSRKFVTFEPDLPSEAVSGMGRVTLQSISIMTWWQVLLTFVPCCCCVPVCYLIATGGEDLPEGWPSLA